MSLVAHFDLVNQTINRMTECLEYVPKMCSEFAPKRSLNEERILCAKSLRLFTSNSRIAQRNAQLHSEIINVNSAGLLPQGTENISRQVEMSLQEQMNCGQTNARER